MTNLKELKHLTKDLNILYVEDDIAIQNTMVLYLNKFFSLVTVANNGLEGLELFKKSKFDIVITDLSMPKMNGLDMIKNIKTIDETQSILITTAHGESNFLLDAISSHVDGYILKPFDYESLNFELFKVSQKIHKFEENKQYKIHLQDMLKQQTKEISENYEKSLYSMIDLIEQRDTYTAGHSKRVAHYCELIAKEMGYDKEKCTLIHQAGIVHDIGKIETPDAVLLNPKKLNNIEYKLIQEHVDVGYQLLHNIPMFESLADIVNSHHERYDGLGYPNGLKGEEINPLARIMIVADAFDAMTTNRIYKARKTISQAIDELIELSEKQFDPEVVKSAVIALKDVSIDNSINQLPKTKLEEERFAYFYKDTLCEVYNQSYLDVVLMKNNLKPVFKNMLILSINNFSSYNKKNGWERGDKLLKEFGNILAKYLEEDLIFRIFGDDFIVISKTLIDSTEVLNMLDKLMVENSLDYKINSIDLNLQKIEKLTDIEMIQAQ